MRRVPARRVGTVLCAMAVVVAACGGGPAADSSTTSASPTTGAPTTTAATATTTTSAGFTVTSDDGDVTVAVGPDALAADPGITIDLLSPEEYPPELAAAATDPSVKIYDLGPPGLRFDAPVVVSRTFAVEQFAPASETSIPVIYLMTRTEEGTYELYDDLRVVRAGDVVEVSGTTTHFSPLIAVNGLVDAELTPGPGHSVFATEVGAEDFFAGVTFRGSDGTVLNHLLAEWGRVIPASEICEFYGEIEPTVGGRATLTADPEPGHVGLVGPPALNPEVDSVEIVLEAVVPVECLDPATSLIGATYTLDAKVDHPGGSVIVPNEDFRGGLSAFAGTLVDSGRFAWVGLIDDRNGNGRIDLNDEFLRLQQIDLRDSFVDPLFGYGDYFAYVIDALSFVGLDGWGADPMSVADAVIRLAAMFVGEGRPETAIGVLGDRGAPLVVSVGSEESSHQAEDSILPLLEDWQVIYGWR